LTFTPVGKKTKHFKAPKQFALGQKFVEAIVLFFQKKCYMKRISFVGWFKLIFSSSQRKQLVDFLLFFFFSSG
jgi:hypothetical protein